MKMKRKIKLNFKNIHLESEISYWYLNEITKITIFKNKKKYNRNKKHKKENENE